MTRKKISVGMERNRTVGGKILPNYYSFIQKTKFQVTPFTIFQKLLPKSNQPPILPTQNIYNL